MATAWELRRRLVVTIDRIPGLDEAAAGSKFRNVVLPVKVKTGAKLPIDTGLPSWKDNDGKEDDTIIVEVKTEVLSSEDEVETDTPRNREDEGFDLSHMKIKIEHDEVFAQQNIPKGVVNNFSPRQRPSLNSSRPKRKSRLVAEEIIRETASSEVNFDNDQDADDKLSEDEIGRQESSDSQDSDSDPDSNKPEQQSDGLTKIKNKRIKHVPTKTICQHCGKCYARLALTIHIRRVHQLDRPHKCESCDKTFGLTHDLTRHVNYLHTDQPKPRPSKNIPSKSKVNCPHCDKTLGTRYDLKNHINRIHLNDRPHKCELCENSYLFARELAQHVKWKHGETDDQDNSPAGHYSCSLCSKKLTTSVQWAIHQTMVCQVEGWDAARLKKEFKVALRTCPIEGCDKILVDRPSEVQRHVRTHTGSRPFTCAKCGRSYTEKRSLNVHSKVCEKDGDPEVRRQLAATRRQRRSKEKPFFCLVCQPVKRFMHAHILTKHNLKSHPDRNGGDAEAEEKEVICNLCGESVLASKLVSHRVRVHDTQRTVVCPQCERRFFNEHDRDEHVASVHVGGGKGHICKDCGAVYRHRSTLSVHRKVHRGGGKK